MKTKLKPHNVEQSCRGYAMYELAKRGYVVQFTDSRFPTEDLLVVSPEGKHFGVDVKGQSTKNFWRMKEPIISEQLFYFLIYLNLTSYPELFIIPSSTMNKLWHKYRNRMIARGAKEENIWGVNWSTPIEYKDDWSCLPK